jgi:hypothetical protein
MSSNTPRHKVFISYHHDNDQLRKNEFTRLCDGIAFVDESVNTGDIADGLTDERIRTIIRDEYLRETSVTIVLAGTETKKRKHVDWEIYSSMYDGAKKQKIGYISCQSTFCQR